MGWNTGSRVFAVIIDTLQNEVSAYDIRRRIYEKIIPAFRHEDWDTLEECLGKDLAYDDVLRDVYGLPEEEFEEVSGPSVTEEEFDTALVRIIEAIEALDNEND